MKTKLLALVLSIILIVPVFYIALCVIFDLDIFKSTHILDELYTQGLILKRNLKVEVFLAFIYGLLPLIGTILYIIGSYKKSSYGYAQFADFSIIKKMKLNFKKGLYFAYTKENI